MDYGMKVRKRNESVVDFDRNKIFNAIEKAVLASHTDEVFDSTICNKLVDIINDECFASCYENKDDVINIEDIQDIVERTLIKNGFADTAKEYILYHQKRNEIRNTRDSITNTISTLLNTESYENDLKRDNGNIDGDSPMGTMLQIGSNVSKNYYLNNMISKDIVQAYTDGFIHIHDLDFYALTLTCCQIDCLKLFKDGFNTGHGHLREPNSIGSYATLAAIAIQSNQNDQHGGQAIPNFDYAMAPGIYKTFRKVWKKNVRYDIQRGLLNEDDFTLRIDHNNQYNYVRLENMFDEDDSLIESVLDSRIKEYRYDNLNKVGDCLSDDLKQLIDITCDETENACYQAMEGIVHNLNTLHCLPKFERIWVVDTLFNCNTLKLITIEELFLNFSPYRYKVLSYNKDLDIWEWKFITNCVNNGIRNTIIKTKTTKGQTVYTTDNHKFLVRDKNTDNIIEVYPKEINEVLVCKNMPGVPSLPAVSLDHYHSRKRQNYLEDHIPLTPEFAELLGYYVADGSVTSGSCLSFTVCDEALINRIVYLMKYIYGENITYNFYYFIDSNGTRRIKDVRFNAGKVFCDCFKDICGKNAYSKKIPEIILKNYDDSFLIEFLKAYFWCDARCSYYIEAFTVSYQLSRDILFAIYRLGEIAYVSNKTNGYNIIIGGKASERIGLKSILARECSCEYRKDNKISKNNLFAINSSWEEIPYNDCVYDISVEDNENFMNADGILIHNSRAGAQVECCLV